METIHWPDNEAVVILGFLISKTFLACGLMNNGANKTLSLTDQLRQLKQWRMPMLHNKNMLCKLQYHDLERHLLRRQAKTQCSTMALRVVHAPSCTSAMFVPDHPVRPPMTVTVCRVKWTFDSQGRFTPEIFTKELKESLRGCTSEQVLKMGIGPGSLLQVIDNHRVIRCILKAPKGPELPEHAIVRYPLSRGVSSSIEPVSLSVKPKSLRAQKMSAYMSRLGLSDLPLQPCIILLNSGYTRLGDWLSLTSDKVRGIRKMPRQFADHFANFDTKNLTVIDLMHASGLFDPLGKLKLCLVMQHCGSDFSETCLHELMRIDSISHTDACIVFRAAKAFVKFVVTEDLARWCWPPAQVTTLDDSDSDSDFEPPKSHRFKRGATM